MRVMTSYKRWATALVAVLGLVSMSASAQPSERPTSRSAVAIPTIYQTIPVKDTKAQVCTEEVITCGRDILYALPAPYKPSDELDTVSQDEVFHFSNGVVVYLLTIHGVQDDAIRAERYRVSFRQDDEGLHLVQVGRQQQCARGHVWGWTMRPCP